MGGKVIHLSDALHARLRSHCLERDVPMKVWTEAVIIDALTDEERSARVKVLKKQLPTPAPDTGDEPWSRPPFWTQLSRERKSG